MLWLVEPERESLALFASGPCDCIIGLKTCNCNNGLVVGGKTAYN